ncbi:cysteine dioxygenase type 1 [Coccinella septempunctata]|uniref:cysteine dioxygenase type 1 n=1 Tax=Coccinella septempunctata TaxID=41139 RepID=UPI001D094DFD|nr:cysteine dioxygenase type 1 [Coccinella septempunctata]
MSLCRFNEDSEKEGRICDFTANKHLGTFLPVINSLDDLIRELKVLFDSDKVNVEFLNYLMKSYKSKPADWKKFAKFDRYRYTRNLVDTGNGKYNLMLLCWGEGHGSGIHDHANSHCFMKVLQGSIEEVKFAWPTSEGEELKEIGRTKLELNDTCYINNSIGLHRVENSSNVDTAISLHLYCPPYDKCLVFNKNTAQTSVSTVTFYSMYGVRLKGANKPVPEPEDN